ncbi:MAG TPA: O-antigen ligase family protein [Ferruginibacter sp.]|nr:O-antigen ligase family protein [Ferruginibacter sp.]
MNTADANKIPREASYSLSVKQRVWKMIFIEKLKNPLGYIFLMLATLGISFLIAELGPIMAVLTMVIMIGLPMAYAIIVFPEFGIITILVSAYLVMWVDKIGLSFPTGTLMDALQVLLILGFFLKQKYDKNWDFISNPISIIILVWIGYSFLEAINPQAESKVAWIFTVRTVAVVMLTYFIFIYHIRTVSFIRLLFKIWIALSVFAALYSFKQEYFGFFGFEKQWLANNPSAEGLYFINNHWRKFSIFSDPVTSAYNMVISSLLCITLLFGPISKGKKVLLGFLAVLFFMAMLHTGTRGAFVLIPAGLAMLLVLRLNKKTLLLTGILAVAFIGLIKMPTSNETLGRFQSAFYPSNDASFNLRKMNQKRIQPYIQLHPMGGGLGSTGAWGERFSPGSYLASFPPDSGYVRVAVEMGSIGLLLMCTLIFIVLKTGIQNYFAIQDPELKNYCLAMILIVFALNIGNYPQEALVQYPTNIYFCLAMALINITLKLDREKNDNLLQTVNGKQA